MRIAMRAAVAICVLALGATTQLSCSVNDYCLNCATDDGGLGDGNGSDVDGGIYEDAPADAGCVPTGAEECDGKDNDCNGLVDDGVLPMVGELCANQQGACAGGVYQCDMGKLSCTKAPSPETCDGIDNNCSGTADEGDPGGGGKCGTDMGECVAGRERCNPQTGMVECFDATGGTAEVCDAKDNDCDGLFDEGLTNMGACGPSTDAGECVKGTLVCEGGTPVCKNAVFPKFEVCNGKDDDCNNQIDEIFNLQTDPLNCGTCGTVCPAPSKTCINTNNNTNGTACTMDAQCPGGSCVVNSQPRCNGGCTYSCNAGFKDIDGIATNGCEYRCFATGAEVCDGVDNDCDGDVDESVTPPAICLAGGECGVTAPVAKCTGAGGWTCTYPGDVQFPETKCDGKNNDCDANTDEAQPNLGDSCSEVPETACGDALDNDNDGFVNDGCPAVNTPETGADCDLDVDDDGDGAVNDGCPAREERGVCKSFGSYTCDPANLDGPATCTITQAGAAPDPNETCDAKDNDCDGDVDEGAATGNLVGQDWVDIGGGKQMMKYEASKPDADASDPGSVTTFACSRAGVKPWANVTYLQALAACQSIGASLCGESAWHRTCSVVAPPTYPITASTGGTLIEAEDYYSIGFGQINTTAETGTNCTNDTDDDGDGWVNDGCAAVGAAETGSQCAGAVDNDGDGRVNDGCPARGPTTSWVPDYSAGFSGISGLRAQPNIGTTVSAANAPTQAARVDYLVTIPSAGSWHVWLKMYAVSSSDNQVHVGVSTSAPPQTPTASVSLTNYGQWRWIDAGTFSLAAGNAYVSIYMGDDGVKLDQVYLRTNTNAPPNTINPKGNKWAFASNANTYVGNTCNGDDLDTDLATAGDQDDILKTGSLADCNAATGTGVFDMSGNVKEWTLAHAPGENPIRGGASNNTAEGISCPLNFTLADDGFFFPNVGFRCCR